MTRDPSHLTFRFAFPHALALAGVLAGLAPAQEPEPSGPARTEQPPREQTLDIEFRGGTLADYVAVIRNAGEKINIVMPPEAAEVRVPPLSLVDAEVEAALEVVAEVVSGAGGKHHVRVGTQRSKYGRPIHVILVQERQGNQQVTTTAGTWGPQVRVFSLRALTERLPGGPGAEDLTVSPKTILTAVDTGLSIAATDDGEKAVIRYHEDSGLLFVRGTTTQIGVVSEVLSRMQDQVERRRQSAKRPAKKTAAEESAEQPVSEPATIR